MLAAFFLGCTATEIMWIRKMRDFSGLVDTKETERMGQAESAVSADAGVGMERSLRALQEHLTEKTQASPVVQGRNEI
jgi:hypothetical protein